MGLRLTGQLPLVQTSLTIAIVVCTGVTWGLLWTAELAVANPMWHAATMLILVPELATWNIGLSRR